jgi:hypothetical protein
VTLLKSEYESGVVGDLLSSNLKTSGGRNLPFENNNLGGNVNVHHSQYFNNNPNTIDLTESQGRNINMDQSRRVMENYLDQNVNMDDGSGRKPKAD